jgi:murein DD-endopeptidase MepM/ murein hydrolase activator NlpD
MGQGLDGQIPPVRIDSDTKCAFLRGARCDIALAVGRGLFETGLSPRFPPGLRCRGIDDGYAIDYTDRRDRRAYHGGIDIPAPFGTSIVVAASGVVVSKSEGERGRRGREVILRHSPDDTGLPVWTYTQYAHLDEMPDLEIGQHVEMGNVIGPTGNSGNGSETRRPAVHFAAWFSEIPAFAIVASVVIPVDGHWMDPIALYRGGSSFDSAVMKALPGSEKQVDIPVMIEDGSVFPPGTKVIWPYACAHS